MYNPRVSRTEALILCLPTAVFMPDGGRHQLQLYRHPLVSKYSKMVTMEFVVNLDSGDRFVRPLRSRVSLRDSGQAGAVMC